jgi:uncharacterized protein YukJ
MPITNYSVLAGVPVSGKVVKGSTTHYQITVKAKGGSYVVALNIESAPGSEVLYVVKEGFVPPDEAGLLALPMGMTAVQSVEGGLALDFVRGTVDGEPMVRREEMTLLPQLQPKGLDEEAKMMNRVRASALHNAVITLMNMTIADKGGVIYAFGSAYAAVAEKGRLGGIHDVHMNQGSPVGGNGRGHGGDNGVWQDGGLLIHLPGKSTWMGIFLAFQTQSWTTDGVGDPA